MQLHTIFPFFLQPGLQLLIEADPDTVDSFRTRIRIACELNLDLILKLPDKILHRILRIPLKHRLLIPIDGYLCLQFRQLFSLQDLYICRLNRNLHCLVKSPCNQANEKKHGTGDYRCKYLPPEPSFFSAMFSLFVYFYSLHCICLPL